jgi:hypothetical protein
MSSWAGEAGARHAFLPNSFRFGTETEAKAFIERVKETWIPKGFIWTTRTLRSRDPVDSRWDSKEKEVVRLTVTGDVTPAVTIPNVTPNVTEEEDEIPSLVNEKSYRTDDRSRRRQQRRRIFNREAWRNYQDESRWLDKEGQTLLSEALREDLRHLMSHDDCRFGLSRKIYEGFKAAHGGIEPGSYVVTERAEHGACDYGIEQEMRQIKGVFAIDSDDDPGPHYATSEFLVAKSVKKGAKLKALKTKLAKPEAGKDEAETALAYLSLLKPTKQPTYSSTYLKDCAGSWGKRHGHSPYVSHDALIEAATRLGLTFKPFKDSDADIGASVCDVQALLEEGFELGEVVQGSSAMEDLCRWLAMPEVIAQYKHELAEFCALPHLPVVKRPVESMAELLRRVRQKAEGVRRLQKVAAKKA